MLQSEEVEMSMRGELAAANVLGVSVTELTWESERGSLVNVP